jgi:pyridoxamine 5'-phosphate oxidase
MALMPVTERSLLESNLDPDPHRQFAIWFQEAIDAGEPMPGAMALATVDEHAAPSLRMMLLEHFDDRGFIIQTNLASPKAQHLSRTPRAALAFFWPLLVRQVRVTGSVAPISRDEMARYYEQTPPGVRAMLRACHQSQTIPSRAALEQLYADSVATGDLELPDHWGGYLLTADTIEFWQARTNWLQDRLRYTRLTGGGWRIERLIP